MIMHFEGVKQDEITTTGEWGYRIPLFCAGDFSKSSGRSHTNTHKHTHTHI